jgi:hypothetical protein
MAENSYWIVCQIGAREHYAVPRALHGCGILGRLITDLWVPPNSVFTKVCSTQRIRDRYHAGLSPSVIRCFNTRMLAFEAMLRLLQFHTWEKIMARNKCFQSLALKDINGFFRTHRNYKTRVHLFCYSYAALKQFRFAKQCGWTTILGQIDPGPIEENIVQQEFERVGKTITRWKPAPSQYWSDWHEETRLADRIVVNSQWSKNCLVKVGVPECKIEIIPLVYTPPTSTPAQARSLIRSFSHSTPLRLLFLGQVNLRKGIPRLLEAMKILEEEPIELVLAGPTDLNTMLWANQRNVRFVGAIPRSEVKDYYLNSDLFILPTLSDGYALTQLEALAYGLPVIASKNCGQAVRDGENGMILSDTAPEIIAAAIKKFLRNPAIYSSSVYTSFGLRDLGIALTSTSNLSE